MSDEPNIIELDYPSQALSLFLQLMTIDLAVNPKTPVKTAYDLVKLCQHLDSIPRITKVSNDIFTSAGLRKPFDLFVLSSDIKDPYMGRQALKNTEFRYNEITTDAGKFMDFLGRLSPEWSAALLRALMFSESGYAVRDGKRDHSIHLLSEWHLHADKFMP